MADITIDNFLIALGFKTDQTSVRRAQDALKGVTTNVEELTKNLTLAGGAFVLTMEKLATQFESMYFQSQRIGASITALKGFSFAASQVGLDVGAMNQSLDWLGTQMKLYPGRWESITNQLTGHRGVFKDATEMMSALADEVARAQAAGRYGVAEGLARLYHLPVSELLWMSTHQKEFRQEQERSKKLWQDMGLTEPVLKQMGEDAHELRKEWGFLGQEFEIAGAIFFRQFVHPAIDGLKWVTETMKPLIKAFQALGNVPGGGLAQGLIAGGLGLAGVYGAGRSLRFLTGSRQGAQLRLLRQIAAQGAGGVATGVGAGAAGVTARAAGGFGARMAARMGLGGMGLLAGPAGWALDAALLGLTAYDIYDTFFKSKKPGAPGAPGAGGEAGGGPDAAQALWDWLHGSTGIVPYVKIWGQMGLAGDGDGSGAGIPRHGDPYGPRRPRTGGGSGSIGPIPDIANMSKEDARFLALAEQFESGGRNIFQGLVPRSVSTAQGYLQILDSNWQKIAPALGITAKHAMDASRLDQWRVGLVLLHNRKGMGNWMAAARQAFLRGDQPNIRAPSVPGPSIPSAASYGPQVSGNLHTGHVIHNTIDNSTSVSFGSGLEAGAAAVLPPLRDTIRQQNQEMVRHMRGAVR